ncbi:hypothetical protein E2C01_037688 [Portunus trituberculatus]|uniref:Uncharacterized protein n=1 Tax=Portunus trituberculatus TaxID=210409 RepID=A0A5B7FFM0_PORTR|nr:hypothetical protein [Portunus trituberculatus]
MDAIFPCRGALWPAVNGPPLPHLIHTKHSTNKTLLTTESNIRTRSPVSTASPPLPSSAPRTHDRGQQS